MRNLSLNEMITIKIWNYSFVIYLLIYGLLIKSLLVNGINNDYNRHTIITQGRGYHYTPPDYKNGQEYHKPPLKIDETPYFTQSTSRSTSYNAERQQEHHHHQQYQNHYYYKYPVSSTFVKSPTFYMYMMKQFNKATAEYVPLTPALNTLLTSRSTSRVNGTLTSFSSSPSTSLLSSSKINSLSQSSNSKSTFATRKYVNVQLPLPDEITPLNVPLLPLQSGAAYATLPQDVTSYDLPTHIQR